MYRINDDSRPDSTDALTLVVSNGFDLASKLPISERFSAGEIDAITFEVYKKLKRWEGESGFNLFDYLQTMDFKKHGVGFVLDNDGLMRWTLFLMHNISNGTDPVLKFHNKLHKFPHVTLNFSQWLNFASNGAQSEVSFGEEGVLLNGSEDYEMDHYLPWLNDEEPCYRGFISDDGIPEVSLGEFEDVSWMCSVFSGKILSLYEPPEGMFDFK